MLNALYIGFICISVVYLLGVSRKEVPLVILLHALLQYVFTLAVWSLRLPGPLGIILLSYMTATTLLLIWGRSLTVSKQWYSVRLFFTVSQWALLLMLAVLVGLRSPYLYTNADDLSGAHGAHILTLHPALKFGGNLMLFIGFFHLIMHWGQIWSLRRSLLDLGPTLLYFLLLLGLEMMQADNASIPFT